ncbi:hypothetical protein I4U23_030900 [Adineta vaga]|nr:hypothetical protein I4U23_030900 [Adineta vaga]
MSELIGKILLTVLAILLPPIAAIIRVGCSTHFWINLVLTILGWLPGVIHAIWLVWAGPASVQ